MKAGKFIAAILCAGMVLTFAGCSSSSSSASETPAQSEAAEAEGTLAEILAEGKITIGMEGNWAPWSYHDEQDNLTGFDAEVAREIAKRLGVDAELVEAPWESLFAGIDSGRYDLVINGVDYTEERAEKYDFSDPYAYNRTALIVRSDNDEISSFEDLKGKTTANSISSTYMTLAESYGATAEGVSTLNETMQLVISGRVDATLNAEVSFYDFLAEQPDAEVKIAAIHDEVTNVCIPMTKGEVSADLLAAVNQALQDMRDDGTLSALSEQFFGGDITNNN
ncbi:MAG: transporter substrate-binding domain-containing protein [Lachnospiraceae bacterium]|nr:transporter substrate-binding domain-containing protein [Lachnospiraceae bacterium]